MSTEEKLAKAIEFLRKIAAPVDLAPVGASDDWHKVAVDRRYLAKEALQIIETQEALCRK